MAERRRWLVARSFSGATVALCLLMASPGCAGTRPAAAPLHEHWLPSYVFGIWGRSELDTRDDCPSAGAASVRVGVTWSTLLVGVVTLGAYTPREVIVRCRVRP